MWIELSDVVGIAIVIYVGILAHTNHHLRRDVKIGMLFSGVALAVLYTLDMCWYFAIYALPESPGTDFILNLITCTIYLMMPLAMSTLFIVYARERKKVRHYLGLLVVLVLAVADIVNIFTPVIFYHKGSQMFYAQFGLILHILSFAAFLVLLVDMIVVRSFDYEDSFLAAFVGVTMFIGLLAAWINYDLKTLWMSMGISYLLMYLALAELYNKQDVITGLANRNAYEKAMAHIKKRYNVILMIDMNGLKKYNDTMGHQVGDQYIYATAKTLADALKDCGKFYRVGGDEFCLVSEKSAEELSGIMEELLARGKCDEQYGDFPIDFAYGIGVREKENTPAEVYQKADQLMYENKNDNR